MYINVKTKFILTIYLVICYIILISFIMNPWILELSNLISFPLAILVICGIAIVPGILNIFLVISCIFDNQKNVLDFDQEEEDITVLIAAYNEEAAIYETLKSVASQDYKGKIYIYAVDNNSRDNTKNEIQRAIKDFNNDNICIEYIFEQRQGKFYALNTGLNKVFTKNVITLDADTYVYPGSLKYLVARMQKEQCAAVAGATMVRNSRYNIITKMQEWDYFLSIAAVKKMQGMFQGTLVAQGAFSIYNTNIVKEYGGWDDCIGEDIVLTWKMLAAGYKVYYEPKAIVFTIVPTTLKVLFTQRVRWARGMIEGFRRFKPWIFIENKYVILLTIIDIAIIYIDFSYVFFWIPGLIAAFFGYYYIVGLMTLLVIPLNLVSFTILCLEERRIAFAPLGLKIRKNIDGYIFFILFYQFIMSPAALLGYFKELTQASRKWK